MKMGCEASFCVCVKPFFGILANESISSCLFSFRNLLPKKISTVCNSSTLQLVRKEKKKRSTVKIESYFNLANPKSVLPSEFPGSLHTCSRYLKFAKNIMEYFSSDKLSSFIVRKSLENTLKIHSSNICTNDKSDIKKTIRCLEFPWHVFLFLSLGRLWGKSVFFWDSWYLEGIARQLYVWKV